MMENLLNIEAVISLLQTFFFFFSISIHVNFCCAFTVLEPQFVVSAYVHLQSPSLPPTSGKKNNYYSNCISHAER